MESKGKFKVKECGGLEAEWKVKNDGELTYDFKNNYLKVSTD